MEIALKPEVQEFLRQTAVQQSRTVDEIITEWAEHYRAELAQAKLEREFQAYLALYPQLKTQYFGEWVAVHNEQVVDHDVEMQALYRRVRATYGKTAVFLQEVTHEPIPESRILTPSYGR